MDRSESDMSRYLAQLQLSPVLELAKKVAKGIGIEKLSFLRTGGGPPGVLFYHVFLKKKI